MTEVDRRPISVLHVTTTDITLRLLLLDQLRELRKLGFEVAGMSASGEWSGELQAAGIRFIAWPHATRRMSVRDDLRAFLELYRVLRGEHFDIVHTHNPKPGVIGRLAARCAGVALVVHTTHGFYATPDDSWFRRALVYAIEWLSARFSHFELYQSNEDYALAKRLRIGRRARSVHIGNGTDLCRFNPATIDASAVHALRRKWGIEEGVPVVGMMGRLVHEKGWTNYFRAAEIVHATHPEAVFLAIGPAEPDKVDALQSREVAEAERHVRFCGFTSSVPEALSLLDVYVLASLREGVPRSAIEAAALGKPLVLTDIRGCREVCFHGTNGLLVPPSDPRALADAVLQLLTNDGVRQQMGVASRQLAVERFDERSVVKKTAEIYRRCHRGPDR